MILPFSGRPNGKKGLSSYPFSFPLLLFLLDLLLLFLLLIRVRRGVEAAFNVVRSPRRSDPVVAMRDSIRPSIPQDNAIRHRLDPFLAPSSAMRGLDPSIFTMPIKDDVRSLSILH